MIHPPIAQRRSPRAFDPLADLSVAEVDLLLEAARWAPSAMNRQPWAFLVGHRGDRRFKGIADALNPGNQIWARNASVLLVALVVNGEAGSPTESGRAYELGLAMGQLGVQAVAMGLITHQMGGFDREQLRGEFGLAEELRPMAVTAVGRLGDPAMLPDDLRKREVAPRQRKQLDSLRLNIG